MIVSTDIFLVLEGFLSGALARRSSCDNEIDVVLITVLNAHTQINVTPGHANHPSMEMARSTGGVKSHT